MSVRLPEHWDERPLKYVASINDESLAENTDPAFAFHYIDIASVDPMEGITQKELMTFEKAPSRARRKVKAGDTIVSTVRTYLGAIAPIPETSESLIVSTGFAVVRPRKIHPRFLAYALREASFVANVVARSVGVSYPAINVSELGKISIPLPPEPEQTLIADVLDRESLRIDQLLGKKAKLLQLLDEKRQALISHTVSRGLPQAIAPNYGLEAPTRFKADGRDFPGELPEAWDVKRLKYSVSINDEILAESTSPDFEFFYVDIGSVDPVAGITQKERLIFDEAPSRARRKVRSGDTIVSTVRTYLRAIAPIPDATGPLVVSTGFAVIRPRSINPRFLTYALRDTAFLESIRARSVGVSYPAVKVSDIGNILIPLPSAQEQAAIADFLDRETGKIQQAMEKIKKAMDCLREYRKSLISAGITGQLDLRVPAP